MVRFPDTGIQQRDLMEDFYIIAQQVRILATVEAAKAAENEDLRLQRILSFIVFKIPNAFF